MKTICATFSHERYAGLVNAIASIKRHFPMMDILVVDDGSCDARVAAWCENQLLEGRLVHFYVRTSPKPRDSRVGGLYENMQYALDWALARDYDMMLTMQDDLQCLWGGQEVLEDVAEFFQRCEGAFYLQSRYSRRGSDYVDVYLYYDRELDAYRMARACNAVGFFSLARLRVSRFHFGRSEQESAEIAGRLGYYGYLMAAPILGDIPMRVDNRYQIVKGKADFGFGAAPGEKAPILRDLTPGDITHLRARDRTRLPYNEDYVRRSDGNDILFPHCIRNEPYQNAKAIKDAYRLEKTAAAAPIPVPAKSGTDTVSEEMWPPAVTRIRTGILAKLRQTAMQCSYGIRHSRQISPINAICRYILRKIEVLLFYYLESPKIRRWFLDSSRKPDAG